MRHSMLCFSSSQPHRAALSCRWILRPRSTKLHWDLRSKLRFTLWNFKPFQQVRKIFEEIMNFSISMRSWKSGPAKTHLGNLWFRQETLSVNPKSSTCTLPPWSHMCTVKMPFLVANLILNIGKRASHGISTEGPAGSVMALRLMGGPPPYCNEGLNLEFVGYLKLLQCWSLPSKKQWTRFVARDDLSSLPDWVVSHTNQRADSKHPGNAARDLLGIKHSRE